MGRHSWRGLDDNAVAASAWLTPARRQKLYVTLTALAPLLVVYGVVDDQTVALWLAAAATVMGTTTAALHTNRSGQ